MARKSKSNKEQSSGFRPKKTKTIVIKGGLPKETEPTSVSPSKSITKPTRQLVSRDQVSIEVDVDELKAMKSCLIDNWIEYGTGVLRLEYNTNIVLKVIEFCKKHAEIRNSNKKLGHENPKDFHSEFVKENQSILIDLLSAACDMQIRSLLDVTSETVADMINGKTAEEIHKMFNLKEDLTFKEMEVVLRYDEFCFEEIM
ncbi:SKP1-like protein 1B [Tanacetum coccineum]